MAIKIVKGSTKTTTRNTSDQSTRKPADYRGKNPAGSSGRWVKWAIMAVFGVIAMVVMAVSLSRDNVRETVRPDVGSYAEGKSPRRSSDGFDMRQWCKDNEDNNKELQARRARMKSNSHR